MPDISVKQFLLRRGVDPKNGIRQAIPDVFNISLRYYLTSITFVHNLIDGNNVLPQLIEDLNNAQHEINISIFLFYNDTVGQQIADILINKVSNSEHPVKVRILMGIAHTMMGHLTVRDDTLGLIDRLKDRGIDVIDTNIDYDKVISTDNSQYSTNANDIRNTVIVDSLVLDHRKLITIDGTIGYCGSANFGDEYIYHIPFDPNKDADNEAGSQFRPKWHDGLVRFIGPIIPRLDEVFHERWILDGGQDYQPTEFNVFHKASLEGIPVDLLKIFIGQPTGKPNAIRNLFKQMIENSKNVIFIENPYLYHPTIVDALLQAKKRNPSIRIDLIVPEESFDDSYLSYDAQSFHYQHYLTVGINVYEYQNHFNHLKIATFDERYAIVGSANLNYRSLENDRDFECVFLIDNSRLAQEINTLRDVDISRSKQIKLNDVKGRGSDIWPINCRNPATLAAESSRNL